MDSRITNHLPFTLNSENSVFAAKSANTMETPRKIPFKQNSSNTDPLKSAMKVEKFQAPQSTSSQATKSQPAVTAEPIADFDFEPFMLPADMNCFCCGSDRMTDGELWGRHLTMNQELMDSIWTCMSKTDVERRPMTPIPEFILTEQVKEVEVPEPLDLSEHHRTTEYDSDADSNTSMVIPDSDLDFSFELDVPSEQSSDDSIIGEW